jgi:hypothetical protein
VTKTEIQTDSTEREAGRGERAQNILNEIFYVCFPFIIEKDDK